MSQTIRSFLSVAVNLDCSTSVLLRAPHGVGKSQIVRQLTRLIDKRDGTKHEVIDRRLSQMTEGDLLGLPSTDDETTRFNPPDWYRKACNTPCVLFLDELNRATPEVMQAAFQIVLDRELNGHKLHPQTRVYAAVNVGSTYSVNEIDPALLDRFWVVDLTPDSVDWLAWARRPVAEEGGGISDVIVDFISANDSWLSHHKGKVNPGTVTPSPRSWEFADRNLRVSGLINRPEDPAFYALLTGFVGNDAAAAFTDFAKSVDNRIDINRFLKTVATDADLQRKLKKYTSDRQNALADALFDYLRDTANADQATGLVRKDDLAGIDWIVSNVFSNELVQSFFIKVLSPDGVRNVNDDDKAVATKNRAYISSLTVVLTPRYIFASGINGTMNPAQIAAKMAQRNAALGLPAETPVETAEPAKTAKVSKKTSKKVSKKTSKKV